MDPKTSKGNGDLRPSVPPNQGLDDYQLSCEMAVVGSLIVYPQMAEGITDELPVERMRDATMRSAYRALNALIASGNANPNITDVVSWMEQAGSDSLKNSSKVAKALDYALNNEQYLRQRVNVIQECYMRRQAQDLCAAYLKTLMNPELDPRETIEKIYDGLQQVCSSSDNHKIDSIGEILSDGESLRSMGVCRSPGVHGIPTGMTPLDRVIGGFQQGELIVIGARPGVGKTSAALNIADHISTVQRLPSGLISMEMSRSQMVSRTIFSHARVSKRAIRSGYASPDDEAKVIAALDELASAPIYIDEPRTTTSQALRAKVRRMVDRAKCSCVFLDYLQLLSSEDYHKNRNEQISEFTRSMKMLARELRIPIVLLSQLRRHEDKKKPVPPTLDDLRDSGSIEADADIVILLHRPFMGRPGASNEELKLTKMIIAKNRDGERGEPTMYFEEEYTRFEEHPIITPQNIRRNYYEDEVVGAN